MATKTTSKTTKTTSKTSTPKKETSKKTMPSAPAKKTMPTQVVVETRKINPTPAEETCCGGKGDCGKDGKCGKKKCCCMIWAVLFGILFVIGFIINCVTLSYVSSLRNESISQAGGNENHELARQLYASDLYKQYQQDMIYQYANDLEQYFASAQGNNVMDLVTDDVAQQ